MKMRLRFLVCTLTTFVAGRVDANPMERIQSANARLGRGVNLGNALEAPNEGEWGVTLRTDYFHMIREAGFDTVRLPVRWSAHALATAPYTIDPVFAARVDWAINQATANRLNIIVNVHHYDEMDAAPDANLARLTALWMQIAKRYKDRPASVYFELYNEPHDKFIGEKWNAAIPVLLKAVRKTNPFRPIIVGPDHWNSIDELSSLRLPTEDQRLIVTVHFYEPFYFTHQGASWIDGADKWPVLRWTGRDTERKLVVVKLEKAAKWSREFDRPIFLGNLAPFRRRTSNRGHAGLDLLQRKHVAWASVGPTGNFVPDSAFTIRKQRHGANR